MLIEKQAFDTVFISDLHLHPENPSIEYLPGTRHYLSRIIRTKILYFLYFFILNKKIKK